MAGDRILENLVRGIDELVQAVQTSDIAALAPGPEGLPPPTQAEAEVLPAAPHEQARDGEAFLTVSPDQMLLTMSLHPAVHGGGPVSLDEVTRQVEAKNVTAPVDWEAIKGSILTCNEEMTVVEDVVIARGRAPVDEVPASLAVEEALLHQEKPAPPTSGRIDFRALATFTLVKKGDVLAHVVARSPGVMGETVFGAAVAFRKEAVQFPRPGKNTEFQEGVVRATCNGKFQCTEKTFWVDEVLDVVGDVDLHVGNIEFPGDVVIRGGVRDGFTVKAGKSLLCLGPIEAAQVECGGDLVTHQGVIGKDKARLHVGGAVVAKFLESCSVECTGPVQVRTSILNATVQTRSRVIMGDRGVIIGGVIRAQNGVSAAQIGTDRGPRTEIHCGIDFTVEQKLVWIRDKNVALAVKLKQVEVRMKSDPASAKVLAPLREKIKEAIHKLNESAKGMVSSLDRNEKADVSVRDVIHPGVYLELCHASHFITRPRRAVSYVLDPPSGKVKEARWQKPAADAVAEVHTGAGPDLGA